jgi:hypothetical protein
MSNGMMAILVLVIFPVALCVCIVIAGEMDRSVKEYK